MVIIWERYIEHNNRYSPWQLWIPLFRVFDLQQLQNGCLLTAEIPQVSHIWLNVGPFDNWSAPNESRLVWCSYFVTTLNFCIDRPCGFSIYQGNYFHHFLYVSNFCLDCPFGFSVHRDAHFCLSRLFRFATYRALFFDKVFLDCISVHRKREFVTILSD